MTKFMYYLEMGEIHIKIVYNENITYAKTLKQVSEITGLNYTYLSSKLKSGNCIYKNYNIEKMN